MNDVGAPVDDILRAIEELRQEYGRELPSKLDELRGAIDAMRRSPDDVDARDAARRVAHRLNGTAGSYGFERVGAAAAKIEAAVATVTGGGEASREAWSVIDETLEGLRGEPTELPRPISR